MRTTIDIETDVLQAAKEMASRQKCSAGSVISRVFRQGIRCVNAGHKQGSQPMFVNKNGMRVLGQREGPIVTLEHVRRLMEEEDI